MVKKASRPSKPQNGSTASNPVTQTISDYRLAAYLFLALMFGLGGLLYYFDWQDDHQIITITLYRDSQASPAQYRVYKYQLQERSFITLDRVLVTVASDERMEILGLAL